MDFMESHLQSPAEFVDGQTGEVTPVMAWTVTGPPGFTLRETVDALIDNHKRTTQ